MSRVSLNCRQCFECISQTFFLISPRLEMLLIFWMFLSPSAFLMPMLHVRRVIYSSNQLIWVVRNITAHKLLCNACWVLAIYTRYTLLYATLCCDGSVRPKTVKIEGSEFHQKKCTIFYAEFRRICRKKSWLESLEHWIHFKGVTIVKFTEFHLMWPLYLSHWTFLEKLKSVRIVL